MLPAYGSKRVELACAHALHVGAKSYKPVERLLEIGHEAQSGEIDAADRSR